MRKLGERRRGRAGGDAEGPAVAWVKFWSLYAAQGFESSPLSWVKFCRFPEVPITKLWIIFLCIWIGRSSGRGCRTPPRARRSQTARPSARKPPRGVIRQRSPGSSLDPGRVAQALRRKQVLFYFPGSQTPAFWGSSGKRGPS